MIIWPWKHCPFKSMYLATDWAEMLVSGACYDGLAFCISFMEAIFFKVCFSNHNHSVFGVFGNWSWRRQFNFLSCVWRMTETFILLSAWSEGVVSSRGYIPSKLHINNNTSDSNNNTVIGVEFPNCTLLWCQDTHGHSGLSNHSGLILSQTHTALKCK